MKRDRNVIQRMMREGPGFSYDLGQAFLNTDNGVPLIQKLAKALDYADDNNRTKLAGLLAKTPALLEMSEADRMATLYEVFQAEWDEFAALV